MALESLSISVRGMTCQNCRRSVERKLSSIPGVTKATVDLDAARADVEYDSDLVLPGGAGGGRADDSATKWPHEGRGARAHRPAGLRHDVRRLRPLHRADAGRDRRRGARQRQSGHRNGYRGVRSCARAVPAISSRPSKSLGYSVPESEPRARTREARALPAAAVWWRWPSPRR